MTEKARREVTPAGQKKTAFSDSSHRSLQTLHTGNLMTKQSHSTGMSRKTGRHKKETKMSIQWWICFLWLCFCWHCEKNSLKIFSRNFHCHGDASRQCKKRTVGFLTLKVLEPYGVNMLFLSFNFQSCLSSAPFACSYSIIPRPLRAWLFFLNHKRLPK